MQFRLTVVAAALLGAIACAPPAAAQRIPPGSYQNSCTDIGIWGADTLVATCRTRGGGPRRTGLANVYRCVGDVGNNNGVLQCTLRGGGQARGYAMGGPPAGGPPPGYGGDRCAGLRDRAEELRAERDRTFDPGRRERIQGRLREVREQLRDCR